MLEEFILDVFSNDSISFVFSITLVFYKKGFLTSSSLIKAVIMSHINLNLNLSLHFLSLLVL